jgi:hypothetical protein
MAMRVARRRKVVTVLRWLSVIVFSSYGGAHNSGTESLTFGGVATLLQWMDGAGTGSNGCSDCIPSPAWCSQSSGSGVAVQQRKGAEATVW